VAADWIPPVVSSVTGLGGVWLGAWLTSRAQERERSGRERGELQGALVELGDALDAIVLELRLAPKPRAPFRKGSALLTRLAPELDIPIREVGITLKLGPTTIWVMSPQRLREHFDRFSLAVNRVAPVATTDVLDDIQRATELITEYPRLMDRSGRADWDERWSALRGDMAKRIRELELPTKAIRAPAGGSLAGHPQRGASEGPQPLPRGLKGIHISLVAREPLDCRVHNCAQIAGW
jgi:hypothetical protein